VSQETRESLSGILEQISAKLEEYRRAAHKQRRATDAMQQSICSAHELLRSEVEKLDENIHRCVEELQCKLEAASDRKTQMENRCLELEEQSNMLSTFVERCQQTIDSTSAVEALRSGRALSTKAAELVHLQTGNDLCSNLRVVFSPTNLRQYLPQPDVNLVGTVSVEHVDHFEAQTGEEDGSQPLRDIVAHQRSKGWCYFVLKRTLNISL